MRSAILLLAIPFWFDVQTSNAFSFSFTTSILPLDNASTNNNNNNTPPMRMPGCVVMDLDQTLWNRPRFKRGPPFQPLHNGMAGIQASSGEILDLFPNVRNILRFLSQNSVPLGLVSSTHRPQWTNYFLEHLTLDLDLDLDLELIQAHTTTTTTTTTTDTDDRTACTDRNEYDRRNEIKIATTIESLLSNHNTNMLVIQNGSKVRHIRQICQTKRMHISMILFFDDRLSQVQEANANGICSVHCPNGLTNERFQYGLNLYANTNNANKD